MAEVWTMGELLCEVMRTEVDVPLNRPGRFIGPYPSGAPAIFADTVARLGHSSGIVGGVGNDDFGSCVLNRLKADGVDCSRVQAFDSGTTGAAFVTYFADGSRKYLFHFSETPATWAKAPDLSQGFENARYFHLMGCSLTANAAFAREIVKTMRALLERGVLLSFDPNIRPELLRDQELWPLVQEAMRSATVLLPGTRELQMLTGLEDLNAAVRTCFDSDSLQILVLKDGSKGSAVYTREGLCLEQAAYPVNTQDPTGAGDCFDGAFLCGLLEGRELSDCAKMAAAAGALNAAAFGPMEGNISRETVADMTGLTL